MFYVIMKKIISRCKTRLENAIDEREKVMRRFANKFVKYAIIEFTVLTTILSLIGYWGYCRMDKLLIDSMQASVAQQGKSIAYALRERFQHKLDELQTRAELLQQNKISANELLDIATIGTRTGRLRGILRADNSTVAGESLPDDIFKSVWHKVFEDKVQAIDYLHGRGLLFAVPFEYENQTCIFYELFSDEAVQTFYKMMNYNGRGTLILAKTTDNWTFISEGLYPELAGGDYPKYDVDNVENFDDAWTEMSHFSVVGGKTNTFYAHNEIDAFFFFGTFISIENHIILAGYVEWDDAVVGLDYIYTIMKLMFVFVFVITFIGVCYHMKLREAKYFEHEKILADSANQAKSDYLSNMSHEIRTPINAIIGMDEMILRESKEPGTLEYAYNLQNAAKSLLGLINDILDFSKIEAGKMEIIPVEYHLSSALNDLVNMIQSRAEKKGLKFIVKADENIPNTLFGDEIRIKQVITNILTNAVKYTEKGSVTLEVTYKPVDKEKIFLCVSVKDTGIGIKKDAIKKLFGAFERIEEERNRMIEGTGLGMNITKSFLEMMGSELKVDSVYGKGSNFSFQILQGVKNPEPIGNFEETYKKSVAQHKIYRESFTAPNADILIVDDTEMNLVVIKSLLKQTKIKIDTATRGQECLNIVKKKKYDIIFLDHMMPGLNGIETLQAMKTLDENLNQDTPVISLTANAISGAREQYISAGFQDYLTKPVDAIHLEKIIIKFLPKDKVLIVSENENNPVDGLNLPDWLKKVDGLNLKAGIEHCGGEESYLEVLSVFVNAIKTNSQEIENYFNGEDWENYTIKVHGLKSTSKVIGADELSEKAKRLEKAGNENNIDEIKRDSKPMLELYKTYLEKFKPLIDIEENNSDKPLIDEAELSEAYESMKEISASFDYDSLMIIFQTLDEYCLPENEIEHYRQIKDAAEKLDWEKLNTLLK